MADPTSDGDEVTLTGRIANAGAVTVQVALRVRDDLLATSGVPGAVELTLDDGTTVRVEIDARTRAPALPETRSAGAWERLAEDPDAALVSSRAPGPHVRATLVRRVARPGARLVVRGKVLESEAPGKSSASYRAPARGKERPRRVLASEIAPEPTAVAPTREPRPFPLEAFVRALAALLLVTAVTGFVRWVFLWPDALARPSVLPMRLGAGATCSLHAAVWLSILLQRRGSGARLLPRFVDDSGSALRSPFAEGAQVFATIMATFMLIGSAVALEKIAALGNLLLRGPKGGRLVDGAWMPAGAQLVTAAVGWLALVDRERREARLAGLFRARSTGWSVRAGRMLSGKLELVMSVYGTGRTSTRSWTGSFEGPIEIESDGETLSVSPGGLVWGMDTVDPDDSKPRSTRWTMGPGAYAAVAGRLDDQRTLRATGPESLLFLATPEQDVLGSLRRGLWTRRVVVALVPAGTLVAALVASR